MGVEEDVSSISHKRVFSSRGRKLCRRLPWEEGEHYDIVSPVLRTSNPEKIEVMEFFGSAGHCGTFEPLLAA